MIRVEGLRVRKNGATICAATGLRVEVGERVGVLGANGSGKSTLLRVVAGLETDHEGECAVDAARRDRVFVHQSPYLFRGTVLANVTYGLRARGLARGVREERARAWMETLRIAHLARRRVRNLSGGERRRVALARALVLEPALLLLDEPFAEMDAEGSEAVAAILTGLERTTVLVASPTDLPPGVVGRSHRVERPEQSPLPATGR